MSPRLDFTQENPLEVKVNVRGDGGLLPPHAPRACPGRGLCLRKSGKPDLRWGRAGEGGSRC
jgi:hypothetical protein